MHAYERLLAYLPYPTISDSDCPACPSTEPQRDFGKALVKEMLEIGIADAAIDDNGYVFGTVPANCEATGPVIGFIAHMDVSDDAPCEPVNPRIIEQYDGGDIQLEGGPVMRPADFDTLADYVGQDLIVSDGNTLLGCDDKAGIAAILTMAEHLLSHPEIRHGTVKIGFTPDEEIGRGADLFDVKRFGADFAYTVDGGGFGEVEYETFNAASAKITVTGKSMHPGTSKGKMVNASLLAMELHSMLPPAQRPEHTEGYEGFYHLLSMEGRCEQATLSYILRDHDTAILEHRKEHLRRCVDFLNGKYGVDAFRLEITDSYQNMECVLRDHWHLIENASKAIASVGGNPHSVPVRGGTDGSRLSFMGLPCPNLGTGSHNHHSRMEYACIQAMDKVVESLVAIARLYTDFKV